MTESIVVERPTEPDLIGIDVAFHRAGFKRRDFSEEEQSCISGKISTLIDEGKPRDQAVAIAISECAPEKARSDRSAQRKASLGNLRLSPEENDIKREVLTNVLPGREVISLQNEDGTWNLLDVPLMSEHIMPEDGKTYIGRKWMERCQKIMSNRFADLQNPYVAPLHLKHHETGAIIDRMGGFVPRQVRKENLHGQELETLFGDLVGIKPHYYEAIRNGDIPYVSIESYDVASYEIDSLSMLADDAPFFKYGNIKISEEYPHPALKDAEFVSRDCNVYDYRDESDGPLVGVAVSGFGYSAMFRFAGAGNVSQVSRSAEVNMNVTKVKRQAEEEEKEKDLERQDDEKDEEEKEMTRENGDGLTLSNDQAAGLMEALGAIAQGAQDAMNLLQTEASEEAAEEVEDVTAPAEQAITASSGRNGSARDAGRQAGLVRRLEILEKQAESKEIENDVHEAIRSLERFGFNGAHSERLTAIRKNGKQSLDDFVEGIKEVGRELPPETWTGDLPVGATVEAGLERYAAAGAKTLQLARKYSSEYDNLVSAGIQRSKRSDYIDRCLKKYEGIEVKTSKEEE